jgi:[lysine-biosynthesis-protein LysW]---L-2-aminoadipate ligase
MPTGRGDLIGHRLMEVLIMVKIDLLYTSWRQEERLLVERAQALGITLRPARDEELVLDPERPATDADAALVRTLGATRGLSILRHLNAHGTLAVNRFEVAALCSDKQETTERLVQARIPTPRSRIAYTQTSALQAARELGFPVVLKPVTGSWARLVSRADNEEHLTQILEHRAALPNPAQHVYYMQEYVDKTGPGGHADLRVFVIGDDVVAAIRRVSPHWVTNTARGATTENQPVTPEIRELSLRTADALGGGVLALDLMEGPDGLLVNEVNHNMEFRNSIAPTGVDIPGRMLEYVKEVARR